MSITIIIELQVKPEQLEKVRPLFSALLSETRNREGNEGVSVHQDADTPTTIILIEKWRNQDLYDSYTHWRAERGDYDKLSSLLEHPPNRRFFEHMSV